MTQIPDSLKIRQKELNKKCTFDPDGNPTTNLILADGFRLGFDAACAELLPVIEEMRKVLNKYANPETHSMDKTGFVWSGDYFDYETAQEALDKVNKILEDK